MDEPVDSADPYVPHFVDSSLSASRSRIELRTWPLLFLVFITGGMAVVFFYTFYYQGFVFRTDFGERYVDTIDGFGYVLVHFMKGITFTAAASTIWSHYRHVTGFMNQTWRDPKVALVPILNRLWVRIALIIIAYILYISLYGIFVILRAKYMTYMTYGY